MPNIQCVEIPHEQYLRQYIGKEITDSFNVAATFNRERFKAAARFAIGDGIPREQSAGIIALTALFGTSIFRIKRVDYLSLTLQGLIAIGRQLGFTSTVTTTFMPSQNRLLDESSIGGVTVLNNGIISPILPGPIESTGLSVYILPSTYIYYDLPGGRNWPPYFRTHLSEFFTRGSETNITWFQIQSQSIY